MAEFSSILTVQTDEAGRPTGLEAFDTGDTLASAIIPSSVIPFVVAANGQVQFENSLPDDTTVSFGDGDLTQTNGKILARHIHAANDLSAAASCDTQIDGPFSATHGLSALNISATNLQADSIAGAFDLVSATDGVSALNISATNLQVNNASATGGVSALNISATNFEVTNALGLVSATDGVSALNISATNFEVTNALGLVSATDGVSALNISATNLQAASMPIPAPFGYMQLDSDDAASVDEKKLGYSNTPTTIVSDGITWDDTNKYFVAADAGTYEVLGVVILEGGSTLVNLSIQKNGSDVLVGQPRVHGTVDPLEHTMRAVFTMTAGQNANMTYDATAANSVKALTGSTMTIKRLK